MCMHYLVPHNMSHPSVPHSILNNAICIVSGFSGVSRVFRGFQGFPGFRV